MVVGTAHDPTLMVRAYLRVRAWVTTRVYQPVESGTDPYCIRDVSHSRLSSCVACLGMCCSPQETTRGGFSTCFNVTGLGPPACQALLPRHSGLAAAAAASQAWESLCLPDGWGGSRCAPSPATDAAQYIRVGRWVGR